MIDSQGYGIHTMFIRQEEQKKVFKVGNLLSKLKRKVNLLVCYSSSPSPASFLSKRGCSARQWDHGDTVGTHSQTADGSELGVGAAVPRKLLIVRWFYNTTAPTPLKNMESARDIFVIY